jgi:hypothetical protein
MMTPGRPSVKPHAHCIARATGRGLPSSMPSPAPTRTMCFIDVSSRPLIYTMTHRRPSSRHRKPGCRVQPGAVGTTLLLQMARGDEPGAVRRADARRHGMARCRCPRLPRRGGGDCTRRFGRPISRPAVSATRTGVLRVPARPGTVGLRANAPVRADDNGQRRQRGCDRMTAANEAGSLTLQARSSFSMASRPSFQPASIPLCTMPSRSATVW